ncbi:hypothetical protein CFC21_101066 [Triticum aestivum]|uniref:WRKY domain-containing protein n=2 Tax=Triticum aestivum TaxID=4565 RepID=A0A3B6S865_WHEAT|nr:uncharacterized protein LOC123156548 [Triticum aestivum]KAF7099438.1 hypothetical protein CFC21_101066 [Triticum aestivum]
MQQDAGGSGGGDGNSMHLLLSILADGEEQARRLLRELPPADDEGQLLGRGPAAQCCRGVAEQLLCTFRKAIAVAKAIEAAGGDSPRSADEGAGAGRDAAQAQERQGQGVCKRRKGLPRWTEKFRIPDDANLEYTPDDGFSWRKYGQKDILGAKFPRGYYRCTYRNAQGCAATRQVQRSDADLAVFDVTYQGAHTCLQAQRRAAAPSPPPPPSAAHDVQRSPPALQDPEMQLLENFRNGLKVETDGLPPLPFHGDGTTAFSFAYAATGAAGYSPAGSGGQQLLQGGGCFVPASFSSPAATTSAGPGYFAHCTRGAHESPELAEVVSAATASDPAGFDYSMYLHQHDLDAHLPFQFDPMFGHPSSSHGQHGDA